MAPIKKVRKTKFHQLKRFKFRADMNPVNLYNLSRLSPPRTQDRTYFQQKWTAKSLTRAYHSEHVREKLWTRMFSRRPTSVVPMNPRNLAEHDGSEQAAGRGSGKEPLPKWLESQRIVEAIKEQEPTEKAKVEKAGKKWLGKDGQRENFVKRVVRQTREALFKQYGRTPSNAQTPYMQMVYWPLERRLDTAIWRALFASSARQARQFVIHGSVKVNGQKIRYPGYLLNPGDMFQVAPERAMWALGKNNARMGKLRKIMQADMELAKNPPPAPAKAAIGARSMSTNAAPQAEATEDVEEDMDDLERDKALLDEAEEAEEPDEEDIIKDHRKQLRRIQRETKELLERGREKKTMKSKMKQDFRTFSKDVKRAQSKVRSLDENQVVELQNRFEALSVSFSPPKKAAPEPEPAKEVPAPAPAPEEPQKPIKTGPRWSPREYMSPFAFIPKYMEVNHAICSAVYLRHPVCGPGYSEVPTPYGIETGGLAFNWYLRRR